MTTNTEQLLREALHKIKYEAVSLGDAQVIALEALTQPAQAGKTASPFRAALMGHGRVAIGQCKDTKSGTPGVIYLDMGDEQRPIDADTSDLFTPGSVADESKVLACIYFATPDAVRQSITVLRELLADQFGVTTPPASQEQAQQPSMVCKTCGADRFKEPCKNATACTMVGEAQAQQPTPASAADMAVYQSIADGYLNAQQPSTAPKRCSDCGKALSQTEIEYYGSTCEQCEGKRFRAVESEVQQPSGGEVSDELIDRIAEDFEDECGRIRVDKVFDFARAILAVATKPEPMTWQPIETAPENTGGLVVVRWLDSDGAVCNELDHTEDGCWARWHDHAEHVEVIGGHGVSYTPPYTHWMPLPDAPCITSTSTKGEA